MCDRESFAKLRDQTEANSKQIAELARRAAAVTNEVSVTITP